MGWKTHRLRQSKISLQRLGHRARPFAVIRIFATESLSIMKLASACALSRLFCMGLIGLASLGCGPGNLEDRPQGDVSGSVTLDGNPMPEGEIYFVKVADGVNEMLPVKDGKFSG